MRFDGKLFILGRLLKGVVLQQPRARLTICRKCWSKGIFNLAEVRWVVPKWEFTLCPKDKKRYFKTCPNCKVIHRKPVKQVRCGVCRKIF